MNIFLLFVLIMLNGVLAMSEIAIISSNRTRLKNEADKKNKKSEQALKIKDNPTQFLSTIQIGITSIGILSGIVGESLLVEPLSDIFVTLGWSALTADIVATILIVMLVTYVSIVIGELVPKRIGQIHPETIAKWIASPMQLLTKLTLPFVYLLTYSTHFILKLLNIQQSESPSITEEELHLMLEEGTTSGVIEQDEHMMVKNIFRLDERKIASLMIPRANIIFLDINLSQTENLMRIINSNLSQFPVCDGGLDKVLGFIHVKQMVKLLTHPNETAWFSQLQPVVYLLETLTGKSLLEKFKNENIEMILVVDEYGEVEGLITLKDIFEAVTGELETNNSLAISYHNGSWLLDGMVSVLELKDILALQELPNSHKNYHTLSGMLMFLADNIPHEGDELIWENWNFKIISMINKRISKVMVTPSITVSALKKSK